MKWLIFLIILIILIVPASATTIVTQSATVIDADSVILNANYSGVTGTIEIWFEYGRRPDFYLYTTPKEIISTNGVYSYTVDGYPILAGKTFYYRGMSEDAEGNQSSFVMTSPGSLTDYGFDAHVAELKTAHLNISYTFTALPKTYEDIMGTMFYGILFGLIFIAIWIRQDDVTIPSILGIIVSAGIFTLIPSDYLKVGYALLVVSIAGIIASILFKK